MTPFIPPKLGDPNLNLKESKLIMENSHEEAWI
jgi:hypothetical protein